MDRNDIGRQMQRTLIDRWSRLRRTLDDQSRFWRDIDDTVEDDVQLTLSASENQALQSMGDALERIRQGIYGICEVCQGPISPARLEALPDAARCIGCQVALDRRG